MSHLKINNRWKDSLEKRLCPECPGEPIDTITWETLVSKGIDGGSIENDRYLRESLWAQGLIESPLVASIGAALPHPICSASTSCILLLASNHLYIINR